MTPVLILHAAHTGGQRWSRDKVEQRREFLQCGDGAVGVVPGQLLGWGKR